MQIYVNRFVMMIAFDQNWLMLHRLVPKLSKINAIKIVRQIETMIFDRTCEWIYQENGVKKKRTRGISDADSESFSGDDDGSLDSTP